MSETQTSLFDVSPIRGEKLEPADDKLCLHYRHRNGELYLGDSKQWLAEIPTATIDLVFADPPYNIKKADWDNFESQEEYIRWSMEWIEHASRILKPTGSLFVCGFSEILADLKHPASQHFTSCKWLVWHYKNKANLGKDWGRSHESLLHLRKSGKFRLNVDAVRIPYGRHTLKYPSHPQATTSNFDNGNKRNNWTPNPRGAKPKDVIELPTTCNGSGETTDHPTQKPEELLRKIILSSTNRGDVVVDPFSGSGTTAVTCEQLGRKWRACDLNAQFNEWAIERLDRVRRQSDEAWIKEDLATAKRRESIR